MTCLVPADLLRVGGIGPVSAGAHAVDAADLELRVDRVSRAHATSGSVSDLPALPDLVVLAAVGRSAPMQENHAAAAYRLLRWWFEEPGAGRPADHRGRWIMPVVHGSAPPRQERRLARADLPARSGWTLLPGAPVNHEGTLPRRPSVAAAMIVQRHLDGQPVLGGLFLELSLPWLTILSRREFRHPLCECTVGHVTMEG
jgi:hypothetical protein